MPFPEDRDALADSSAEAIEARFAVARATLGSASRLDLEHPQHAPPTSGRVRMKSTASSRAGTSRRAAHGCSEPSAIDAEANVRVRANCRRRRVGRGEVL